MDAPAPPLSPAFAFDEATADRPDERFREACLPEHRRRQVARILAAGLLRLKSRPQVPAEQADSAPVSGPQESSDST